jgi:hypothetical protein
MALANQALHALPVVPGVALTCHVATWFWAAQEAQQRGLCAAKPAMATLGNIATMAVPAQPAILALVRSGNWDFAITPTTPPDGCVLLWPLQGTHSAVVSAANAITGYNQGVQLPVFHNQFGHTTGAPGQLAAHQRLCKVIAEDTIVLQAAALDL